MATKSRNVNMEILRIIAMFMVVAGHRFGPGHGVVYSSAIENINSLDYFIELGIFSFMVPVHLFYLISGYFLIGSSFKVKRIYNIWRTTFFYSVVLFFVSCGLRFFFAQSMGKEFLLAMGIPQESLSSYIDIWNMHFGNIKSFTDWVNAFFPVLRSRYGFVCCYVVMYLLSPVMNKILCSLNKVQYKYLVIVCTLVFAVLPAIFNSDFLNISDTSGIVWALYMYVVAGYIRLHFDLKKFKPRTYLITGLAIVLLRVIIRVVSENLAVLFNGDRETWAWYLYRHDFIVPMMFAVCLLCCFATLKNEPRKSDRFVIWLSSVTFGIYLLHDNLSTRLFMWDLSIADRLPGSLWMWPAAFADVAIIFAVFGTLDYLRSLVFNKWDAWVGSTKLIKKRDNLFASVDALFKPQTAKGENKGQ